MELKESVANIKQIKEILHFVTTWRKTQTKLYDIVEVEERNSPKENPSLASPVQQTRIAKGFKFLIVPKHPNNHYTTTSVDSIVLDFKVHS